MQYLKLLITSSITILLLAACGGGGSSGPAMATVTSSNAKDLAIASTNAANQSKNSSALNNIFGKTRGPNTQLIVYETIAKGISQAQQAPEDSMLCSSGTGIIDQANGTLIFTDCTMVGTELNPVILNGNANFSSANNGNTIIIEFVNFTINFNGDVSVVDASVSCAGFNSGSISCSINIGFTGSNGRHYIVGDISVAGDPFTGMTVSATVTDPVYGIFNLITSTPITLNCPLPNENIPDTGTIVFTGVNNTTGSVTYIDCSSYSVTFGSTTNIYTW